MNSIQDRALALIEAKVAELEYYVAVRADYANTGNLYFYDDASMTGAAELTLHYDFQKTHASFYLTDEPVIGRDRPLRYEYRDGFDAVLAEIVDLVTA